MSCSICDIFVPVGIFNYRYAFTIFVTDGYFETPSELGRYLLSFRCSYITGTYAILHAHFLYRYMILVNDSWLQFYFLPYGLVCSVIYCFFHMAFWTIVAGYLSGHNINRRLLYVREPFIEYFGHDPLDINIVIVQYQETSEDFIRDSWTGIGILSVVSLASLSLLVIFGWAIIRELRKQSRFMSVTTKRQQTQLIKALVVQTITPTVACFSPCFFSWYQPVFGIDGGRWLQYTSTVVMSMFPFFDPLSTFFVLPTLRRELRHTFKRLFDQSNEISVQSRNIGNTTTCF